MDMELKDAQAEKSRSEKEKADVTHKLHMMEEKDRHDEKENQEKLKAESKEFSAEKQNLEDQVSDLSGESISLGEALSKEREDVEKEAMEGEEKLKEEEEANNSNIEEAVANSKNKAAKRDALTNPDSPCANSEPEKAAEKAKKAIVEEADHLEKQQKIEECAPLGPIPIADKPKPGLESQEPVMGPDGKPLKGPDGRVIYKKKGAADGDVDCLPPPPLVAAEKPEGEVVEKPEGEAVAENPAPEGAEGGKKLSEEEKLPEEEAEGSQEVPSTEAEAPSEAAEVPTEAAEEPVETAEGDSLLTTGHKKLTNQTPLQ
ncbi:MAG: uncharacterized protein KVP18_000864 [Porospora cf. gigantea A]|nr:MAG: hypothetical protein KVP18_000864 [Porospora cf. gigantea A]